MRIQQMSDAAAWNSFTQPFGAHPLQLWEWGELKSQTGAWTAVRLAVYEDNQAIGGAQVLLRRMPKPFGSLAYLPRGPFAEAGKLAEVADCLADWVRQNTNATSIKIDPATCELTLSDTWVESESVLINKTAVVDLTRPEDEIKAGIPNRKCRQYIRKAERDGIVVRPATEDDLDGILTLYHHTAEHDGFALHEDSFYKSAFQILGDTQQVFVAEADGELQAFLWNVVSKDGTSFELWGAVSDAGKHSRANYYMKWCAMVAAKNYGCKLYDLNGLLNDGISDFKLLFVEEPTYWVPTHDKPLSKLYGLMNKALELHRQMNIHHAAQKDTSRN